MKKAYLLLLFIFVHLNSYGQSNKATVLTYNATRIYVPSIINKEIISVYITKDYVSNHTQFIKKNAQNEIVDDMTIIIDNDSEIVKFNEITFDIKNNLLTEYLSEDFILEDYFAIKEIIPNMKWELISEQKQIGDFLCEKAKTTFRGRTYEVWYATEIPINYGPWKFNGLPGLMVEIKDIEGIYTWQLTSVKNDVEIDFDIETIAKKNSKFKPFTFKDYDSYWLKKRIDLDKMKISRNKTEYNFILSFNTEQNKEPINEWRTQTQWEISN